MHKPTKKERRELKKYLKNVGRVTLAQFGIARYYEYSKEVEVTLFNEEAHGTWVVENIHEFVRWCAYHKMNYKYAVPGKDWVKGGIF